MAGANQLATPSFAAGGGLAGSAQPGRVGGLVPGGSTLATRHQASTREPRAGEGSGEGRGEEGGQTQFTPNSAPAH